jgi:membrane associated rhomboid family serine protease
MLLAANVGVFFLQITAPAVEGLFMFIPRYALIRPWTVVTYMFLHGGFMHLFFNMLGLFFFGPRVEDRLGSKRFAWLYFLSGISGALLSTAFSGAALVGASAGVFGVGLAFAYYWPNELIYIWGVLPIPARLMVILQTVIALFSGVSPGGGGGIAHFAHLGGYVGAYLYLKWLDRARDQFKRQAAARVEQSVPRMTKPPTIDMQRVHEVNRDEVNRILDKISRDGIGSLTAQERVFLSNFAPPEDKVPPTS